MISVAKQVNLSPISLINLCLIVTYSCLCVNKHKEKVYIHNNTFSVLRITRACLPTCLITLNVNNQHMTLSPIAKMAGILCIERDKI